jgi:hypothetical protein
LTRCKKGKIEKIVKPEVRFQMTTSNSSNIAVRPTKRGRTPVEDDEVSVVTKKRQIVSTPEQKSIKAEIAKQPPKAPKKPQPRKPVLEDSEHSDFDKRAVSKPAVPRTASRELTAEECELLEQMSQAANEEAEQNAEKDAIVTEPENESQDASDIEEQEILAALAEDDQVKTPLSPKFPSDNETEIVPESENSASKPKRKAS